MRICLQIGHMPHADRCEWSVCWGRITERNQWLSTLTVTEGERFQQLSPDERKELSCLLIPPDHLQSL